MYNAIFVKDIELLNKIGASKLIYFLISNWSRGLKMCWNFSCINILLIGDLPIFW